MQKASVLLIEDDYNLREYLLYCLSEEFEVSEASDGHEGWKKCLSDFPNLVVSDVRMPGIDGVELCKKIKSDTRTKHIPVILLTGLDGEEQQLLGLGVGANDYVIKPVNSQILALKIKNLLLQQDVYKDACQRHISYSPLNAEPDSQYQEFVKELLKTVEENISNYNFSVEELSQKLFVSRTTLYSRILALTSKTPLDFIKSCRIKKAAQLLQKKTLNVSEICYKVGFRNRKYFAKTFKEEYGVIPSKYIESLEGSNRENDGGSETFKPEQDF